MIRYASSILFYFSYAAGRPMESVDYHSRYTPEKENSAESDNFSDNLFVFFVAYNGCDIIEKFREERRYQLTQK